MFSSSFANTSKFYFPLQFCLTSNIVCLCLHLEKLRQMMRLLCDIVCCAWGFLCCLFEKIIFILSATTDDRSRKVWVQLVKSDKKNSQRILLIFVLIILTWNSPSLLPSWKIDEVSLPSLEFLSFLIKSWNYWRWLYFKGIIIKCEMKKRWRW